MKLSVERLICSIIPGLYIIRYDAGLLTCILPDFQFAIGPLTVGLEPVAAGTELGNGLVQQQLFQRPFLDVRVLILFQLSDVLDSPLQY